jgi:hypothetical protein
MARFGNPVSQYLDDAGDPLVNGKLYFYKTGTNTLQATYADINLSIANTNPVILDAAGRLTNVFLQNATYKVILTKNDDTQIWERDPIGGETALGNFSAWNSLTIYTLNDIVEASDGKFYISIANPNQGNDPTTSPANWTEIKFNQVWNSNQTYDVNDIVQGSDGTLYSALTGSNLNNDPVTDDISWQWASSLDIPDEILAAGYQFAYNNF